MVSTGPPLLFFFSRPTSVEPLFLNPVSLSSSRYIATFNFVLSVHSYRGRRVISPPGKTDRAAPINRLTRFRFLKVSFHSLLTFLRLYSFIGHTQGFTYAEAETDNATIVIAGIGSPQSSSTNRRGSTSRPLRSGAILNRVEIELELAFHFTNETFRRSLPPLDNPSPPQPSIFNIDRNDSVTLPSLDYNLLLLMVPR